MVPVATRRRNGSLTGLMLVGSLCLNVVLLFGGANVRMDMSYSSEPANTVSLIQRSLKWNGGHPLDEQSGSCFCNAEDYCLCSPNLAIDLIILSGDNHIWLVRRIDTSQLATMGGFVEVGETVEQTVHRELMEEMGVRVNQSPVLFGIYSDPRRDNRRHTVSVVYAVQLEEDARPVAADDVKEVKRIHLDEIEEHTFFADHKTILTDFRSAWRGEPKKQAVGDFADDIERSICVVKHSMFVRDM